MTWSNWSAPYYGVQHRSLTTGAGRMFQATVTDRGRFAEAYVLALKTLHPFTPIVERTFSTAAAAREWVDRYITGMNQ